MYFLFPFSFLFFSWDQWPLPAPFEGNGSAPDDCCGVYSALLLTSCFESLVLGFRRPQGCPNMEVESCRIFKNYCSWTSGWQCGVYKLCLLLTCPCSGMSIVPEIYLFPPFLQGRWKCEGSRMVTGCHSWLQFLCWTALEKFKAVLFPEIFLQNWNSISLCLFSITL